MKKLILSVFALAAIALSANAADGTATLGGTSAATLQAPITIVAATTGDVDAAGTTVKAGSSLNFATINVRTAGGTVTVSPANVWSSATMTSPNSGTVASAAGFKISALLGTGYTVSCSDGADMTNSGTTLTLTNFLTSSTNIIGSTDASNTFLVGATLNIPVSPKLGAYAGTFNVTVDYQ